MDRSDEARRTRRLRKYEAASVATRRDDGPPAIDLITPFGPTIGKIQTPPDLVARLNAYCDARVLPDKGCEFTLPPELVFGETNGIGRHIEALIGRWVIAIDGAAPSRIRIEAVWVVSQYANTSSPVHFHSGDVSGVLYLAMPEIEAETAQEQKTYISGRRAGYVNFLIGGKQRFSKSLVSFRPMVGDFYVFPGWLLHGAEPFRGTGERRSLAFNAYVED